MALDQLMFSLRIVSVDSYLTDPVPGLDPCFSEFRKQDIKSVPVVRIFGSTPAGQTTCLHLHGVFPYLMIPYCGPDVMDSHWTEIERYMQQMAASLDSALNSAGGNVKSTRQHVFKVTLLRGIPFYGYHKEEELFLKVFFYLPGDIKRAAELLHAGAVMNRQLQPHEAHVPYILQLFMDYNLHGMNLLHAKNCWFRTPIGKPNPPSELPLIRRPDDHDPGAEAKQTAPEGKDEKSSLDLAEKYHAPSISQLGNFNWNLLRERACGGHSQRKDPGTEEEDNEVASSSRGRTSSSADSNKSDQSLPQPSLSCSNLCRSLMSTTLKTDDSSEPTDANTHDRCMCPLHTHWTRGNVPEKFRLPSVVERLSTCELEVDVLAADVANRGELAKASTGNPGIATIWEDERARRRERGEDSQITPDQSQTRHISENLSEKEAHFVQMLYDALDRHKEENSQIGTFSESMSFTATQRTSSSRRSSEDIVSPVDVSMQDPARRESKDLFSLSPETQAGSSAKDMQEEKDSPKSSAESLPPIVSQEVISQVINSSRNWARCTQDADGAVLSSPDDDDSVLNLLRKLERQDEEESMLHPSVTSQRSNGPLDEDNAQRSPKEISLSQRVLRRRASFSNPDSQAIENSGSSSTSTIPVAPPSDDEEEIETFEMSQRWDSAIQDLLHDLSSDDDTEKISDSADDDDYDVIPQVDGASDEVPQSTKRLGSSKRCPNSNLSTSGQNTCVGQATNMVVDVNDNEAPTRKVLPGTNPVNQSVSMVGKKPPTESQPQSVAVKAANPSSNTDGCKNLAVKKPINPKKQLNQSSTKFQNKQTTSTAPTKTNPVAEKLDKKQNPKNDVRVKHKIADKVLPKEAKLEVSATQKAVASEFVKVLSVVSQTNADKNDEFVSARTHPELTGLKLDWKGCQRRVPWKYSSSACAPPDGTPTKFTAPWKVGVIGGIENQNTGTTGEATVIRAKLVTPWNNVGDSGGTCSKTSSSTKGTSKSAGKSVTKLTTGTVASGSGLKAGHATTSGTKSTGGTKSCHATDAVKNGGGTKTSAAAAKGAKIGSDNSKTCHTARAKNSTGVKTCQATTRGPKNGTVTGNSQDITGSKSTTDTEAAVPRKSDQRMNVFTAILNENPGFALYDKRKMEPMQYKHSAVINLDSLRSGNDSEICGIDGTLVKIMSTPLEEDGQTVASTSNGRPRRARSGAKPEKVSTRPRRSRSTSRGSYVEGPLYDVAFDSDWASEDEAVTDVTNLDISLRTIRRRRQRNKDKRSSIDGQCRRKRTKVIYKWIIVNRFKGMSNMKIGLWKIPLTKRVRLTPELLRIYDLYAPKKGAINVAAPPPPLPIPKPRPMGKRSKHRLAILCPFGPTSLDLIAEMNRKKMSSLEGSRSSDSDQNVKSVDSKLNLQKSSNAHKKLPHGGAMAQSAGNLLQVNADPASTSNNVNKPSKKKPDEDTTKHTASSSAKDLSMSYDLQNINLCLSTGSEEDCAIQKGGCAIRMGDRAKTPHMTKEGDSFLADASLFTMNNDKPMASVQSNNVWRMGKNDANSRSSPVDRSRVGHSGGVTSSKTKVEKHMVGVKPAPKKRKRKPVDALVRTATSNVVLPRTKDGRFKKRDPENKIKSRKPAKKRGPKPEVQKSQKEGGHNICKIDHEINRTLSPEVPGTPVRNVKRTAEATSLPSALKISLSTSPADEFETKSEIPMADINAKSDEKSFQKETTLPPEVTETLKDEVKRKNGKDENKEECGNAKGDPKEEGVDTKEGDSTKKGVDAKEERMSAKEEGNGGKEESNSGKEETEAAKEEDVDGKGEKRDTNLESDEPKMKSGDDKGEKSDEGEIANEKEEMLHGQQIGDNVEKESGNAKEVKESFIAMNEEESGNAKEEKESGNPKEEKESGSAKKEEESGNAKEEKESGNPKEEKESGNAEEKKESGNAKEEEEGGNAKERKESDNAKEEKENANAMEEKEKTNEVGSGAKGENAHWKKESNDSMEERTLAKEDPIMSAVENTSEIKQAPEQKNQEIGTKTAEKNKNEHANDNPTSGMEEVNKEGTEQAAEETNQKETKTPDGYLVYPTPVENEQSTTISVPNNTTEKEEDKAHMNEELVKTERSPSPRKPKSSNVKSKEKLSDSPSQKQQPSVLDGATRIKAKKSDSKRRSEKLKKELKKKKNSTKKARNLSLSPRSGEEMLPTKCIVPVCSRTVEPISAKLPAMMDQGDVTNLDPDTVMGDKLLGLRRASTTMTMDEIAGGVTEPENIPGGKTTLVSFQKPSLDLISPSVEPAESSPELITDKSALGRVCSWEGSSSESTSAVSPTKSRSPRKEAMKSSTTRKVYAPSKKVTRRSVAVKLDSISSPKCMFTLATDDSQDPFPQMSALMAVSFPSPYRKPPSDAVELPRPWSPRLTKPQVPVETEANDLLEQFAESFGSDATKMLDIDPESVFKNMDCIDELIGGSDVHLVDVQPPVAERVDASGKDFADDKLLKHFDAILEDVSSAATSKDLCKPEASHLGDLEEETLMDLIDEMTSPTLPLDSSFAQHPLDPTVPTAQPSLQIPGVDSGKSPESSSCFFAKTGQDDMATRAATPCVVPGPQRFEHASQPARPASAFTMAPQSQSGLAATVGRLPTLPVNFPPSCAMERSASVTYPDMTRPQSVQGLYHRSSYPPMMETHNRPNSVAAFQNPTTVGRPSSVQYADGDSLHTVSGLKQQIYTVQHIPGQNIPSVPHTDPRGGWGNGPQFSHSQPPLYSCREMGEIQKNIPTPNLYHSNQGQPGKNLPEYAKAATPDHCLYDKSKNLTQPTPRQFPTYTAQIPRPASVVEPLQVFHTHVHHHHHVHSIQDTVEEITAEAPSTPGHQFRGAPGQQHSGSVQVKTEAIRQMKEERANSTAWPKTGAMNAATQAQSAHQQSTSKTPRPQCYVANSGPSPMAAPASGPMLVPVSACVTHASNMTAQQMQFLCPPGSDPGQQYQAAVLCQTTAVSAQRSVFYVDAPSVLLKGTCQLVHERRTISALQKGPGRVSKPKARRKPCKKEAVTKTWVPLPTFSTIAGGAKPMEAKTPYGVMKRHNAAKTKAKSINVSDRKRKSIADFRKPPPGTPTISLTGVAGQDKPTLQVRSDIVSEAFNLSQDMFETPVELTSPATDPVRIPRGDVYSYFNFATATSNKKSTDKKSPKNKVKNRGLKTLPPKPHVCAPGSSNLTPSRGEELVLNCVTGEWEIVKSVGPVKEVPVLFQPEEQTLGSPFYMLDQVQFAGKRQTHTDKKHSLKSVSRKKRQKDRKHKDLEKNDSEDEFSDLKRRKRSKSCADVWKPLPEPRSTPEYVVAQVNLDSNSPKLKLTLKKPLTPLRGKPHMAAWARASIPAERPLKPRDHKVKRKPKMGGKDVVVISGSSDDSDFASRPVRGIKRRNAGRMESGSDSDFRIEDISESTEDASEIEDLDQAELVDFSDFDLAGHIHSVRNMYVLNRRQPSRDVLVTMSDAHARAALGAMNLKLRQKVVKKRKRKPPTTAPTPAVYLVQSDKVPETPPARATVQGDDEDSLTGAGLPKNYEFYDSTTTFFQEEEAATVPPISISSNASSPCSVDQDCPAEGANSCEGSVCSVPPIKIIRLARKLSPGEEDDTCTTTSNATCSGLKKHNGTVGRPASKATYASSSSKEDICVIEQLLDKCCGHVAQRIEDEKKFHIKADSQNRVKKTISDIKKRLSTDSDVSNDACCLAWSSQTGSDTVQGSPGKWELPDVPIVKCAGQTAENKQAFAKVGGGADKKEEGGNEERALGGAEEKKDSRDPPSPAGNRGEPKKMSGCLKKGEHLYRLAQGPPSRDEVEKDLKAAGLNSELSKPPFYGDSGDAQATSHRLSSLPPYIKKPKAKKSAKSLQEHRSPLSEGGLRHWMLLTAASATHPPNETAVLRQKAKQLLPENVRVWDHLDAVSKLPDYPVLSKIFLQGKKVLLRPAMPPPSRESVKEWLKNKKEDKLKMGKNAPLKKDTPPQTDDEPDIDFESKIVTVATTPVPKMAERFEIETAHTPGLLKRSMSLTPSTKNIAKTPTARRVSFDLSHLSATATEATSPSEGGIGLRKRRGERSGNASKLGRIVSESDSGLCSSLPGAGVDSPGITRKELPFASLTSPVPHSVLSVSGWDTSLPFDASPPTFSSARKSDTHSGESSAIKTLVGSADTSTTSPVTFLISGTFTPMQSSSKKTDSARKVGETLEAESLEKRLQSTPNVGPTGRQRKPALRKLAFTPIQDEMGEFGADLTPIKEVVSPHNKAGPSKETQSPISLEKSRKGPQGTPSTAKGSNLRKTVLAKRFFDPDKADTPQMTTPRILKGHEKEVGSEVLADSKADTLQSHLSLDSPQIQLRKEGSQILGPTFNNTYGFKAEQQHLGEAKSLHVVQHVKTLSVELHVKTRIDLRPDPDMDEIRCLFYCLDSDAWVSTSEGMKTGAIVVDVESASEGSRSAHDSQQPSTSRIYDASVDAGHKRKLMSRSGVSNLDTLYVKSEMDLFLTLAHLVHKWDPDILIGYEVQMLSWGFLLQRAAHLRCDLCRAISRVPADERGNRHDAAGDTYGADNASELHIVGRIVLNLWRLMRTEVALYDYTFESIAYHLLHERHPSYNHQTLTNWYDPPVRGAVAQTSDTQRWRVIDYYVSRVRGNLRLLAQQDLIGRTSELARLFGFQFYEVLTRGTQFRVESMLLRAARLRNLVAVTPSVLQRAQMRAPEVIALVMEPESKFYHVPVLVLDFQSLYPSVVIAYNLCYSTCLGKVDFLGSDSTFNFGCTSLHVPPRTLSKLLRKNLITITPSGVAFVRSSVRRGVMPQMLDELLTTRIMVKNSMKKCGPADAATKRMLDHRQLGLKLIANVTYGYTAANFSGRMPSVEVGDSIVHKARETLERAIRLVTSNSERWEHARVVYGDTDSMFIALEGVNNSGCTKDRAFEVGREIAAAVTADNPTPVKLKFEKVYLPCILQTKKRYAGYAYESEEQAEPNFDAKGIETVRRDGTPATAKILEKMLRILFETRDVSEVKKYVLAQCSKILDGRTTLKDCILAKEYRGKQYYKPGAVIPALNLARKMLALDKRAEPRVGERVPYVVVHGAPGTPLYQLVRSPLDLLKDTSLQLNGAYYVLKQVLPALDRMLSLLGVDVFLWHRQLPRTVHASDHYSQDNSQNVAGKKATISHFFKSKHCFVCKQLSVKSICDDCLSSDRRKQATTVLLMNEAAVLERRRVNIEKVCMQCTGAVTPSGVRCVSLDCPILYQLYRITDKCSKTVALRKSLAAEELF